MGSFAKFIIEAEEKRTGNPKNMADGFINMYNKLSRNIFTFVEKEKITNDFGNLIGYLYIYRMQGLRINFKDGQMHSFSRWEQYSPSKAPETTILLKNYKKLTKVNINTMYSELTGCLGYKLTEAEHGYRYGGKYYGSLNSAIMNSYFKRNVAISTLVADFAEYGYDYDRIRSVLIGYAKHINQFIDFDKIYAEEQKSAKKKLSIDEPVPVEEVNPEEIIGSVEETENTEILANVEETLEPNPSDKFADEDLIAQIIADPLPVFRKLNSYVLMTAQRINNALLITGQGGVGKSYNVNRILSTFGQEGKDYVIMKGASSTAAMYMFLYNNYNKIVVFDDCDSVLVDDDAINILKGALDSGRTRKISYNKAKSNIVDTFECKDHTECEKALLDWSRNNKGKPAIPSTFEFKGGIIFISNMSAEKMAQGKAAALLTRCMQVDIKLMASEVILRMESCLPSIKVYNMDGVDITNEEIKKEVFAWISSDEYLNDSRIAGKEISFRLFNKCYMYKYAKLPMWKELSFCI